MDTIGNETLTLDAGDWGAVVRLITNLHGAVPGLLSGKRTISWGLANRLGNLLCTAIQENQVYSVRVLRGEFWEDQDRAFVDGRPADDLDLVEEWLGGGLTPSVFTREHPTWKAALFLRHCGGFTIHLEREYVARKS